MALFTRQNVMVHYLGRLFHSLSFTRGVKGCVNQSVQTKRFPLILDDVWEEPAKLLEKLRVLGFNSYNQTTLLDVRQSRDIHNKNQGFDRR